MSFFKELQRRNVFRVAAAYVITGWLLVQALELAADTFEAPAWIMKMIVTVIVLGLIPTLLFSWAYELTPEGIKREHEVDREASITRHTGRKLDLVTLVAAVGVAALFAWQQMNPATVRSELAALPQNQESSEADPGAQSSAARLGDQSIAVLPFANMANHPDNEPFTVGIHDDLLTNLSKISALKVISRTSVLRYRDSQKSIGEIADELGVATVLEGGVQRAGNQIRINVQLIDATTDEHLWAEKYDRQLTAANIFQIQSEISGHIANALRAQLTADETASLAHAPTQNLDAYNAYLAGRQRMLKRTSGSLEEALELFKRATQLDPDYALAYVGQADVYNLLHEYSDLPRSDMLASGEPLARKALQLSPQLAEAHTSLGAFYKERGEFERAEASFKRALLLNPNYATTYHWYSALLRANLGRPKEALEMIQKAATLDPLSPVIQASVGWCLEEMGMHDEALAQYRRTIELDPEYPGAVGAIAGLEYSLGNLDEGIIWLRKAVALDPGNLFRRATLVLAYTEVGDIAKAKQTLAEATALAPQHDSLNWARNILDLVAGDYDAILDRTQAILKTAPDNRWNKEEFAFINMVTGNDSIAASIYLELYPGDEPQSFKLTTRNLYVASILSWSLRQIGRDRQAEDLIERALALTSDMKPLGFRGYGFERACLLAIQDKTAEAAEAFSEAVDAGVRSEWWMVDHLPYLASVREHPVFRDAFQRLVDDVDAHRERLRQHDLKEAGL